MYQIKEVNNLLSEGAKIAIVTHNNPDGDAMGASLAMYHYLNLKGYSTTVISPSDFGNFLKWMPGNEAVINFLEKPESSKNKVAEADIIFCLDFNGLDRTQDLAEPIKANNGYKVLIDHHLEPDGFEDYKIWNPTASATTEIIFDFIEQSGDANLIDNNIATCIYTGIMTDTGSFRFSSTNARVHRIISELMEKDINHVDIHEKIYDSFTQNSLRFFGYCTDQKLTVLDELRTAYIYVTKDDIARYNIQKGQTDGLVNFTLSLSNVVFGALIKEGDDVVKISFRSKGRFPANKFAAQFFEGGGHLNAAGGKSDLHLPETINKFKESLEVYKPLLLET